MKDVPSVCSHQNPTKADVLAREKARSARRLSIPETLLLLTVGGAAGFFALQPAQPVLVPLPDPSQERAAEEPDEVRPKW